MKLLGAGAGARLLTACAASPVARAPLAAAPVRGICFDLFTLFDPRSVVEIAASVLPAGADEFCAAWRVRQFEYSWLRTAAESYADFREVTAEALTFAARERRLQLSAAQRERLLDAYTELEPWPDTKSHLAAWRRAGLKLAPLANFTPQMIDRLLARAELDEAFDAKLSTHAVRVFKPHPRAYALGPAGLRLPREHIVFAAFGGWDAAGAKWFGFPTFWVNRLGVTPEAVGFAPDASGPGLGELADFVSARSPASP